MDQGKMDAKAAKKEAKKQRKAEKKAAKLKAKAQKNLAKSLKYKTKGSKPESIPPQQGGQSQISPEEARRLREERAKARARAMGVNL